MGVRLTREREPVAERRGVFVPPFLRDRHRYILHATDHDRLPRLIGIMGSGALKSAAAAAMN
ncbi:hypothetical protein [Bosea sp. TAF32]|uniref:hypothetical protein n=1 Tax=Bosea sp. TAF32 TaxID=3237482 RepID=UPI003F8F260B